MPQFFSQNKTVRTCSSKSCRTTSDVGRSENASSCLSLNKHRIVNDSTEATPQPEGGRLAWSITNCEVVLAVALRGRSRQAAVIQLCFFFLCLFRPSSGAAPSRSTFGRRLQLSHPPTTSFTACIILTCIGVLEGSHWGLTLLAKSDLHRGAC